MAERLSDADLEGLLYYACSSGTGAPVWVRKKIESVCIELRERREVDKNRCSDPGERVMVMINEKIAGATAMPLSAVFGDDKNVIELRLLDERHVFRRRAGVTWCDVCGYPEHETLKHLDQPNLGGDAFDDRDNTETEEQRISMGCVVPSLLCPHCKCTHVEKKTDGG